MGIELSKSCVRDDSDSAMGAQIEELPIPHLGFGDYISRALDGTDEDNDEDGLESITDSENDREVGRLFQLSFSSKRTESIISRINDRCRERDMNIQGLAKALDSETSPICASTLRAAAQLTQPSSALFELVQSPRQNRLDVAISVARMDAITVDLNRATKRNDVNGFSKIIKANNLNPDNIRFSNSLTPLHVAVIFDCSEMVLYLLNVAKVDPFAVDIADRSSLDWAKLCANQRIMEILEEHMKLSSSKSKDQKSTHAAEDSKCEAESAISQNSYLVPTLVNAHERKAEDKYFVTTTPVSYHTDSVISRPMVPLLILPCETRLTRNSLDACGGSRVVIEDTYGTESLGEAEDEGGGTEGGTDVGIEVGESGTEVDTDVSQPKRKWTKRVRKAVVKTFTKIFIGSSRPSRTSSASLTGDGP